jgi:Endomembrane protein 70
MSCFLYYDFLFFPLYTVKHRKANADSAAWAGNLETCSGSRIVTRDDEPQLIDRLEDVGTVVFTYDVIWERSDVPWSQRWDVFLMSGDSDDIHWFSIINVCILLFINEIKLFLRNIFSFIR